MPRRVIVLVAVLLTLGAPAVARADCDGPYASFREAAPTARRVIVGDVVELRPVEWDASDGTSSRFTVRGWSLLDGVVPDETAVDDVLSTGCSGYLIVRFGDVVAIAFDGVAFTNRQAVNAIAWVDEQPPNRVGLERITLQEAFDLVGVSRPDVLPTAPAAEADQPTRGFPLSLVAGAVLILLLGAALLARALRSA